MPSYQSSYTGAQVDAILAEAANVSNTYVTQNTLFNLIYPVGSIYMSVNSTSPATLFGGTWEQIQDTFLLSAGSTYTAGGTGGAASHSHTTAAGTTGSHTLTVAEMPSHMHDLGIARNGVADNYWFGYNATNATTDGTTYPNLGRWRDQNARSNYYGIARPEGGGGGHTHPQTAVATDSISNMPPYLVVYIWKRTA